LPRIALVDYAPDARMPAHEHESFGISIVLRGGLDEVVGRRTEQAGTSGLVVKPAGTVHANRFGPRGARLLSVMLRPEEASDWIRETPALAHWRWMHATAALRVAVGALHRARSPLASPAEQADALLLEISRLLADERVLRGERRAPGWLVAVRDRLHAEYGATCRVRDLAAAAGVHPVYLARVFRRHFGCSLTAYLRQLRVRAAAAALADEPDGIAAVAGGSGFADQSHLCRSFRAVLGVAPGAYRALARAG
jgi:AraC family transcriptional regulator